MPRITRRVRRTRKILKGGNNQPSFLTPDPIVTTPLKYGATNPGEEAFLENQIMAENQQRMNDGLPPKAQTGGNGEIVVPQSDNPLASQPGGTNEVSAMLQENIMQQEANAVMDGCVGQGGNCTSSNYWDGKGGKRKKTHKRKTYRKTKKYTKRSNKKSKTNRKTKKYVRKTKK